MNKRIVMATAVMILADIPAMIWAGLLFWQLSVVGQGPDLTTGPILLAISVFAWLVVCLVAGPAALLAIGAARESGQRLAIASKMVIGITVMLMVMPWLFWLYRRLI